MNAEQRKEALTKIQEGAPCMTGITLMYQGERETFNAFKIPLSCLTYNPYNGRIGSVVKSYERQHHQLDAESPSDIALIEKFLKESKPDANAQTRKSLLENHQQRFGIVTADGRIIDGNRRACLLNDIWRDKSIDANLKGHAEYFIAVILPIDADKREILRLETTYQMGEDAKVDYGPIEKYLKARDLADANFQDSEIASFMGVKPAEVASYLRILKLMDEYLDNYGCTGIYTLLRNKDNGTSEDSFIKLEAALRTYRSGNPSKMWAYDVEADVSDLKNIAFDYIRSGIDQQEFRDIIRLPNANNIDSSFFANEEIWRKFVDEHYAVIENMPQEKTVEETIRDNPNADVDRLLRARDTTWRERVCEALNENYQRSRDKLNNRQQAAEPIKLLRKAWEALKAVDTNQPTFKSDSGVKEYINDIGELVEKHKQALKQ